jgi:hypothetical protein
MLYEDGPGRYKLRDNEFGALIRLGAAWTVVDKTDEALKERCKAVPGLWRDMRLLMSLYPRVIGALMHTVPLKKLAIVDHEMRFVHLKVYSGADPGVRRGEVIAVDENALLACLDEIMSLHCLLCDKTIHEAKTKCPYYHMITDLHAYEPEADPDMPKNPDGKCFLAGWDHLERVDP